MFADQFIKFSTRLASPLLYGFGEHQEPLLINVTNEWKRLTFYSGGFPPIQHVNLYGFPFSSLLFCPLINDTNHFRCSSISSQSRTDC